MFCVSDLDVSVNFRSDHLLNNDPKKNWGFGSLVIEEVNRFLRELKAKAYLIEDVDDEKKKDFYLNHGWERKDGEPSVYLFYDGQNKFDKSN